MQNQKVILVELDYKGDYERFALTQKEFQKEFLDQRPDMPKPSERGEAYTLRPLVHVWYLTANIGGERWKRFFSDMEDGLPQYDIDSGNLAYIDYDKMHKLRERVFSEFGEK